MTTTIWDRYPDHYRDAEIREIVSAVSKGESVALLGLSGSGKSNLLGYLAARVKDKPRFYLIDCNRLSGDKPDDLAALIIQAINESKNNQFSFGGLQALLQETFSDSQQLICLILDRFDAISGNSLSLVTGNLRALRDQFKYKLTYIIGSRCTLPFNNELSELLLGHTFWLGPLSAQDAEWSIRDFVTRHQLVWDDDRVARIMELSGNYPSLVRALCTIVDEDRPLDVDSLRNDPLIQKITQEILADNPSDDILEISGLRNHPLFPAFSPVSGKQADELTLSEHRLAEYLQAHAGEICAKDDLIRAVWSEEKFIQGIRDDSLAQLVHRLRTKIETNPLHPQKIQTVPGRGYRFIQLD
jgi:energy-coupling factor transporter ATP-binding protein EcfA2